MTATAAGIERIGPDHARALHLVDLDSLLGPHRTDGVGTFTIVDAWLARAGWRRGDHVSIAGRHPVVLERIVWQLAVGARMYAVRGHAAVDGMLFAHDVRLVARRFDRLVIGGGDRIFAPFVVVARERGMDVSVVARPGSVHEVFARHGIRIVDFDLDPGPAPRGAQPVALSPVCDRHARRDRTRPALLRSRQRPTRQARPGSR